MKNILFLFILCVFSVSSQAQLFTIDQDLSFKRADSSSYRMPLAGGLNQAQFSQIDFNNDGDLDLFAFDRSGNKVSCFIAHEFEGEWIYFHDPQYDEFFPEMTEFMILKDYNGDHKPDLWTYDPFYSRVMLYKNIGDAYPVFRFKQRLRGYNHNNPPFDSTDFIHFKGNLPAVVDMDLDGDVDFVSNLNYCGASLVYFRNLTEDNNESLEDIHFDIPDYCLGNISDNGIEIEIIHDTLCPYPRRYKKKHCGFRTLNFFDDNDDRDLECIFGSSEQLTNPVYVLHNAKTDQKSYKDSFITIDTAYFDPLVEPLISVAPASSIVDVNLDGAMDLILSTNETSVKESSVNETQNVLLFLNTNTTDNSDFDFVQNDFLVEDMLDFGAHTAPALADLDNDGDLDLLIATNGDDAKTNNETHQLVFFKNIGDTLEADFILTDMDYANIKKDSFDGPIIPSLADLDNDGDLDLLLGLIDGTISLYRNNGSPTAANFQFETANYSSINVGERASPCLYDLDEDGLTDLLVGEYDGNINYFRNTGTSSSPVFSLITDSLGGIVTNELIYQSLGDTFIYFYFGNASLGVADLSNKTRGIVAGGAEGKLRVFTIPNNLTADFTENTEQTFHILNDSLYIKDWGADAIPAVGDLDRDGYSDILIGNSRGGLHFLTGRDTRSVKPAEIIRSDLKIYPNPTQGELNIAFLHEVNHFGYEIYDLSGRVVQADNAVSKKKISLNSDLVNGTYFIRVMSEKGYYLPYKFVIIR
ncbi:MAG: T9SS type A sorting domain-containing protein [Bacteroidia bacterium]